MKNSSFLKGKPNYDFLLKSYLIITVIPLFFSILTLYGIFFLGSTKDLWKNEGALAFYLWAVPLTIIVHIFSFLVSIIFILFLNRRFMSGSKLTKKTRFGLFGLAFLFYLVTMSIASVLL